MQRFCLWGPEFFLCRTHWALTLLCPAQCSHHSPPGSSSDRRTLPGCVPYCGCCTKPHSELWELLIKPEAMLNKKIFQHLCLAFILRIMLLFFFYFKDAVWLLHCNSPGVWLLMGKLPGEIMDCLIYEEMNPSKRPWASAFFQIFKRKPLLGMRPSAIFRPSFTDTVWPLRSWK